MSSVVGDNRENLKESIANLKTASARLDNTLDAAGKVMAKIDRGEGTLGKLVNDNTAHTSLTDTLDGVNRYVRKYDALHMTLMPWVEYQTGTSDWKYYLNLKIQPTADKYYLLGVVNDPRGKRTDYHADLVSVDGRSSGRDADSEIRGQVEVQRPAGEAVLPGHGPGRHHGVHGGIGAGVRTW